MIMFPCSDTCVHMLWNKATDQIAARPADYSCLSQFVTDQPCIMPKHANQSAASIIYNSHEEQQMQVHNIKYSLCINTTDVHIYN